MKSLIYNIYGFSNGTSKVDKRKTVERGQQGVGFSLTADNHFHLRNKRLTNVGVPVEGTDATTKKFVADLLKTKASTTYLKNELGKKADKSKLSDYVLKSDLNKAISEINKATTELNTLISALKPKV